MASTIWHTVEFSRNRRASPPDLSTRPRGFVVLKPTWLFGRSPPPSRAASAGLKPVPRPYFRAHEAPEIQFEGWPPLGTSHRGSIRGVRSSLSGRHREQYARGAA